MGFSAGLYTASFETRNAVSGFHKKENVKSTFSVHQKLKLKHTSSTFPWIMKHHCPPLLAILCRGSAHQIQGLGKEYLTASESKFETLQLTSQQRMIWFSGLRFKQRVFSPCSKMAPLGSHPPLWTWALWLHSGFQWKKKGAAEDSLPQITHQSWMATSRVRRGALWLHHLAEARVKTPMPF